jgi:2-methylaconitate cis-trans-isomerase PrpF
VNLTSYNVTTGVATGNLSHVQLKLAGMDCSAVIDGVSGTASDGIVRFTYATSTATGTVLPNGGNLHFYNVSGCAGLFTAGDPATISGKLSVRPKQTITSP